MFGLFFITATAIFIFIVIGREQKTTELSPILAKQLDRLWDIATISMREQKTIRAEKALLTILRFDEKNASAYNRLGILYAKSKQFKEAIECFEIAQSLDSSANGLHNAGLIYFETGNYAKAALAFEQAIVLEGDLPQRYIAYAKAQEKLANFDKAITALETAFELNKSPIALKYIADIYQKLGDQQKFTETRDRLRYAVWMRRATAGKAVKQLSSGSAASKTTSTARPKATKKRPLKTVRRPIRQPKAEPH
jgi:tetratricopeptide (TPR) repeat protein